MTLQHNEVVKKEEPKIEEVEVKVEKIEEKVEDSALKDIVKNDYQEQTRVNMEPVITDKIGIASDHRGYKMKQKLTKYLNETFKKF